MCSRESHYASCTLLASQKWGSITHSPDCLCTPTPQPPAAITSPVAAPQGSPQRSGWVTSVARRSFHHPCCNTSSHHEGALDKVVKKQCSITLHQTKGHAETPDCLQNTHPPTHPPGHLVTPARQPGHYIPGAGSPALLPTLRICSGPAHMCVHVKTHSLGLTVSTEAAAAAVCAAASLAAHSMQPTHAAGRVSNQKQQRC